VDTVADPFGCRGPGFWSPLHPVANQLIPYDGRYYSYSITFIRKLAFIFGESGAPQGRILELCSVISWQVCLRWGSLLD
jgi:hypothetical protein